MTSYWQGPISDNMATYLQQGIIDYAYLHGDALSFFNDFGLIDDVPRGAPKVTTTKFEKMAPGQIGFDVEHLPISKANVSDITSTIAVFGTIIQLNKLQIDLWREQTSPRIQTGDMMSKVLDQQMQAFIQQIDNFLFWGDDMRSVNVIDNAVLLNSATFTGMMNGFTADGGGTGGDDNVTAANDYWDTVSDHIKALKQAGHSAVQYILFSDLNTYNAAQTGNNFYSTFGGHESDFVIARKDVAAWIASANCYDNAGTDYRLATTYPVLNSVTRSGKPGPNRSRPYRVLRGYNFELVPIYNGAYDMQMNVNIGLLHSCVIEETFPTAIRRTNGLTLA